MLVVLERPVASYRNLVVSTGMLLPVAILGDAAITSGCPFQEVMYLGEMMK